MSGRTYKVGFWFASALVVSNMVGSGIFLLPATLASYGSISILGWICSSIGALLLALVFAQLGKLLPAAGGPYAYTREGFGDFAGFIVAWGYWIGVWSGNAAIAISCIGYLTVFFPVLSYPAYAAVTALLMIWFLTWVNTHSLKNVGTIQYITTILKLIPLIFVGIVGWFYVKFNNYLPFNGTGQSDFSTLTSVTTLTLWAFIGVESATIPADHIENPEKNIPRATMIGTLVTAIIYILSTMAVMGLVPPEVLKASNAPFADATRPILGTTAYYLFAAAAALACFGTLNGWILIQGQVPMAAANNRLFPSIFGELNAANLPAKGIIISSVLVTLLMMMNFSKNLVGLYTFTLLMATMTTLIPYVFCAMALPLMYKNKNGSLKNKNSMLVLLLGSITFLYMLWVIYGAGKEVVFYSFFLILLGIPIYVWLKWKQPAQRGKL